MGKKSFPNKLSGLDRSSNMRFENTVGRDPKRVGGKKVKKFREEEVADGAIFGETVLYQAPVLEIPVRVPEIKPSFKEQFMRGLWSFMRGERAG